MMVYGDRSFGFSLWGNSVAIDSCTDVFLLFLCVTRPGLVPAGGVVVLLHFGE